MAAEITLEINGQTVTAEAGDTVLTAARKHDIDIPTLCAHEDIRPSGACRLCIVEIEGMRGFPTSCTTPATAGMKVQTETKALNDMRREILKLLMSTHTSPCMVCNDKDACDKFRPGFSTAGRISRCGTCSNRANCTVRKLSDRLELTDMDLPSLYTPRKLERDDPFMDRDYSVCILCGRCVRACENIHGKAAINFTSRGKDALIGTAFNRDHLGTECTFCGGCVDICPTGTLSDRYAKWFGAADNQVASHCALCPNACALTLKQAKGKVTSTAAIKFDHDHRLCAVGRFAYAPLMGSSARLRSHQVRIPDGMKFTDYTEALAAATEKLKNAGGFACIASEQTTRESVYLLKRFTKEVMHSEHFTVASMQSHDLPDALVKAIEAGKIQTLLTTGNYLSESLLEKIETVIVIDNFASPSTERAAVIFADTMLAETEGTLFDVNGDIVPVTKASISPGDTRDATSILIDLANALGTQWTFDAIADITASLPTDFVHTFAAMPADPRDNLKALPAFYRGHDLSELIAGLKTFAAQAAKETAPAISIDPEHRKNFQIVEKKELAPNTHMITIYAPNVAKKCQPGQFVMGIVNERSERIPYTIADWDAEAGTVTINVLEMGRSSREIVMLREGDVLNHFAGPLGSPIEIKKYGTVLLGGGCYGVGSMYPLARALKQAGNTVIVIEEASSEYLLYWQDKLSEFADEFIIVTKDGTVGVKGGVQTVIDQLVSRGEKIDQSFIIGCTFMMMLVSEQTKAHGIPCQTAMNPIMLDGTGMCGACRVTVGDTVKFACIDGPFLDGHLVDWTELKQRQSAYKPQEKTALAADEMPAHKHPHGHTPCHLK